MSKRISKSTIAFVLHFVSLGAVTAAIIAANANTSLAADKMAGKLHIMKPWSRATPTGARVGAGYMTIHNMGKTADRLVSGSSDIAGRVEIHEMKMNKGIMQMRRLPDGLMIPAGESVELKPGGYHIMFMELKKPIKKGAKFTGTFTFEKAGKVQLQFEAEGIGAMPGGAHGHKGKMKH